VPEKCHVCLATREQVARVGHNWVAPVLPSSTNSASPFGSIGEARPCSHACGCTPECFSRYEHDAKARPETLWIPAIGVTVTVSAYNDGAGRMIRVAGPSGEAGMAPLRAHDHDGMARWALARIEDELREAMKIVDEESVR